MEENLKQRLVGAGVLAALAIIFLPALFDRDQPVIIDTTTQIPPAPVIKPVVIPKPSKPREVTPPPAEKLFQPSVEALDSIVDADPKVLANTKNGKPRKDKQTAKAAKPSKSSSAPKKPQLNDKGVPLAWVVQAASFKAKDSADKFAGTLKASNYKAYSQSVKTDKGTFFRVLIGPYVDESKALSVKKTIDKQHKLTAKVLRFNPVADN